ncbi:MAG: hypothetical protein LH468_11040 [Nocardioides sp.]|nr:hypothetical protein [Nocardioides sp.]
MSDPGTAESDWERKRRLALVFGDVLPETTADERDLGVLAASEAESASEAWLKAQVPPHHG